MSLARLLALMTIAAGLAACQSMPMQSRQIAPEQIHGQTYRLERAYLVSVHVPGEDVNKVLEAIVAAVGLNYGNYDRVAYLDAPGIEQYRPTAGSKAGEYAVADRQPTVNLSFSLAHDAKVLKKAIDAACQAHSYEEPVIYVSEVWRTRETKADESNPNRWWNRPTN